MLSILDITKISKKLFIILVSAENKKRALISSSFLFKYQQEFELSLILLLLLLLVRNV